MNSHLPTLQVACLQEEIDILSNQMSNQAFHAHNYGAFRATNNPGVGLEFNSQTTDINMDNRLNQIQMFSNREVTSDNQEFYSQMDITVPTSYEYEEQLYNVPSGMDLPESLSGGMNQEMLPFQWNGSSSNSSR